MNCRKTYDLKHKTTDNVELDSAYISEEKKAMWDWVSEFLSNNCRIK